VPPLPPPRALLDLSLSLSHLHPYNLHCYARSCECLVAEPFPLRAGAWVLKFIVFYA
jgi:hypothetical protein